MADNVDHPVRIQFSIRLLLVAMAIVAAGMAAYRIEHSWQGRLAIHGLTWLLATASILSATQATGKLKAFWVGTAFVLSVTALHVAREVSTLLQLSSGSPYLSSESIEWMFWCAAPANGLLGVFVYQMFWNQTPSENPISR